ncbi:MAG: non-homologous end-joining DNA ligase [Patescibacteria group bacterium]
MLPKNIPPMLAVATAPFDAEDHTFELKWDGIRCLSFIDGGTRLQSRNLRALNEIYPDLDGLHQAVRGAPCVLDGEIVALRDGKPSFLALQKRHHARLPATVKSLARRIPVVYMIFDVLYWEGKDITRLPFRRRREILEETLAPADRFILTQVVPERGRDYFAAAAALGLEGVVGKKLDGPYLPGRRSRHWVKFKHTRTASFAVCGWTENPTARGALASLVLGAYVDGRLANFGLVGTGFSRSDLAFWERELKAFATVTCPFTGAPLRMKGFHWAEPRLVCDVQYLELTDQGTLRHPLYRGLREDVAPEECVFPPVEEPG